jgi:hypothetical protein
LRVLLLPEAMRSTCNVLSSLGLRWWQHMIVRRLHEHCIAAELIGYRKTVLIPKTQLCPSHPTTPFKLCKRRFPKKKAYLFKKKLSLNGRSLNIVECLMFVDPCIIVQFIQKNPTRCNCVSKFIIPLYFLVLNVEVIVF